MKKYRILRENGKYYPQKTWFFNLLWGYYSYEDITIMNSVSFNTVKESMEYILKQKEFDKVEVINVS